MWLSADEQRVWRNYLTMTARLQSAMSRQLQADCGLSLADYDVLVALDGRAREEQLGQERGCRIAELGERLGWEQSRLSHQLSRMRARGLVVRSGAADDRRAATVELTDDGRAALESSAQGHVDLVRDVVFKGASAAQLRALDAWTSQVLARLGQSPAQSVHVDINGASAIVTGGASGIGAASARQLADRGARVVVADLQAERGEALAKEIGGVFVTVDVTNTEQIEDAVNTAVDLGPLRALVNSAGIGWAQRTIGKDGEFASAHNLDAYKKVLAINLVGTFDCIRIAATAMSRFDPTDTGERGAIVNMTSVAAFDGQIGQAAYSSSKGGVVGLTLPVARDLSAVGIRVNTVAPGLIDTPIYGEGEASEAFKAKLGESVLFPHRLGKPEELASMVVELITNSYMNAEVVRVDGGIRMPPK